MSDANRVERLSPVVLIIEDQMDWLRRIQKVCERAGYAVQRAPTSEKAASLLARIDFDAVICDLRLKEWEKGNVEGLQVLATLPENRRPGIIVLTGYPDPDDIRSAFRDFKVVDVLLKYSFSAELLVDKLALAVRLTKKSRTV